MHCNLRTYPKIENNAQSPSRCTYYDIRLSYHINSMFGNLTSDVDLEVEVNEILTFLFFFKSQKQ